MKSPTLALLSCLLLPSLAVASGGHSYTQKPDLVECEPLKPNFKELEKADAEAKKWGVSIEEAKAEKEEFKVLCEEVKARPNAQGNMARFQEKKVKVLQKYEALKKNAIETKKQFAKIYFPLKELGAKVCEKHVKTGHDIVEAQTKKAVDELRDACQGGGPVATTASR